MAAADPVQEMRGTCDMTAWWGGRSLHGQPAAESSSEDYAGACCARCAALSGCLGWTYEHQFHQCRVMNTVTEVGSSDACISGQAVDEMAGGAAADVDFAKSVMAKALTEGSATAHPSSPAWDAKDIVIVSAWRRPEFLLRTLSYLLRAEAADSHFFLFVLDLHSAPEVLAIARACPVEHLVLQLPPHFFLNEGWGNSFAILEGFRYAASLGTQWKSRLTYLVEEVLSPMTLSVLCFTFPARVLLTVSGAT
jgi:hypothetical protein